MYAGTHFVESWTRHSNYIRTHQYMKTVMSQATFTLSTKFRQKNAVNNVFWNIVNKTRQDNVSVGKTTLRQRQRFFAEKRCLENIVSLELGKGLSLQCLLDGARSCTNNLLVLFSNSCYKRVLITGKMSDDNDDDGASGKPDNANSVRHCLTRLCIFCAPTLYSR